METDQQQHDIETPAPATEHATPAADDTPESVTVRLSRPIQAHGREVTELVVSEPSPRHLEAMDRATGPVAKVNLLLSEICQVPTSSIYQLRMRDYGELVEALGTVGFTVGGEE